MKKRKNNVIPLAIILATLPTSTRALEQTVHEATRKKLEHLIVTTTRTDIENKNAPAASSEMIRGGIDHKIASTLVFVPESEAA